MSVAALETIRPSALLFDQDNKVGHLSTADIDSALEWLQGNRATDGTRYDALITAYKSLRPLAAAAEKQGKPGVAYMSQDFYDLKLSAEDAGTAIHADTAGNRDGRVTRDEFRAVYGERYPELRERLPQPKAAGASLRKG